MGKYIFITAMLCLSYAYAQTEIDIDYLATSSGKVWVIVNNPDIDLSNNELAQEPIVFKNSNIKQKRSIGSLPSNELIKGDNYVYYSNTKLLSFTYKVEEEFKQIQLYVQVLTKNKLIMNNDETGEIFVFVSP